MKRVSILFVKCAAHRCDTARHFLQSLSAEIGLRVKSCRPCGQSVEAVQALHGIILEIPTFAQSLKQKCLLQNTLRSIAIVNRAIDVLCDGWWRDTNPNQAADEYLNPHETFLSGYPAKLAAFTHICQGGAA